MINKFSKKMLLLFALFAFLIVSTSCFKPKEKKFVRDDYEITLNSSFVENKQIGLDLSCVSRDYIVAISKNETVKGYTLEGFVDEVINAMQSLNVTISKITHTSNDGVEFVYLTYVNTGGDGVKYAYGSSIFRNDQGVFYIIDMAVTEKDHKNEQTELFVNFAKTFKLK